jgi:hypothetical protein
LKCCGKCYLRKQLSKVDKDRGAETPLLAQLSKFEISPFVIPAALTLAPVINDGSRPECRYDESFPDAIALSIFHPPG